MTGGKLVTQLKLLEHTASVVCATTPEQNIMTENPKDGKIIWDMLIAEMLR